MRYSFYVGIALCVVACDLDDDRIQELILDEYTTRETQAVTRDTFIMGFVLGWSQDTAETHFNTLLSEGQVRKDVLGREYYPGIHEESNFRFYPELHYHDSLLCRIALECEQTGHEHSSGKAWKALGSELDPYYTKWSLRNDWATYSSMIRPEGYMSRVSFVGSNWLVVEQRKKSAYSALTSLPLDGRWDWLELEIIPPAGTTDQ